VILSVRRLEGAESRLDGAQFEVTAADLRTAGASRARAGEVLRAGAGGALRVGACGAARPGATVGRFAAPEGAGSASRAGRAASGGSVGSAAMGPGQARPAGLQDGRSARSAAGRPGGPGHARLAGSRVGGSADGPDVGSGFEAEPRSDRETGLPLDRGVGRRSGAPAGPRLNGRSEPRSGAPAGPRSFAETLASAVPALPAVEGRPVVIALVGPTGAGKTTTAAKLCRNAAAFAGRRVGIITLDGFRARALGQFRSYPGLSPYPMAAVFTRDEVRPALKRLRGVDAILVDTPGHGPRGREDAVRIRECLWALRPDEVHFVLPAGLSTAAGLRAFGEARAFSPTHLLPTKLDEYPEDVAILSLARRLGLAMRWVADGQRVPGDLRPFTLSEPAHASHAGGTMLEAAGAR